MNLKNKFILLCIAFTFIAPFVIFGIFALINTLCVGLNVLLTPYFSFDLPLEWQQEVKDIPNDTLFPVINSLEEFILYYGLTVITTLTLFAGMFICDFIQSKIKEKKM